MQARGGTESRKGRWLGIGLLILGLVHTPLPAADYHNIRHHDGPGEVCRLHDHLLRWHPNANLADDIAILHWHWVLPMPGGLDPSANGQAPRWLAAAPDWSALGWENAPQLPAEVRGRWIGSPDDNASSGALVSVDGLTTLHLVNAAPRSRSTMAFSATFARGARRASLLQRWNC